MRVKYEIGNQNYFYDVEDKKEISKLNFVLTNNKGDFLNLGYTGNVTKFSGFNVCNSKTLEIFKILDEILLDGMDCIGCSYEGYVASREFSSKITQSLQVPVDDKVDSSNTLGDEGELRYDDRGVLVERVEEENSLSAFDRFYVGPTGGVVYELNDYEGKIYIDLDMREQNDFNEWGRNYEVYEKDGIVYVKFTKFEGDDKKYDLFFGVKAVNFSYDLIKDFVKKEYSYSKDRGSLSKWYVYRLMSVDVDHNKRLVMGAGFSEEEVLQQIFLLFNHQRELEGFDKNIFNDFVADKEFEKPLTQDVNVAYKLSVNAIYRFLNKDLDSGKIKAGAFAGFPWFANIWIRDELVGIRSFINNSEESFVKDMLYNYLNLVDYDSGLLPRIEKEGALESADGCFWLAKRFEDFMYHLEREGRLSKILTDGELKIVYEKFHLIFKKLVENYWDSEEELLKVKKGDSWMDTIDVEFPLDIQVQFLELISFLVVLAQLLGFDEDRKNLYDFEELLKSKIKSAYFRGGYLYDEINEDKISCNVFLVYYFYPTLFTQSEWELIFDNSLSHLRTSWGGIGSISFKDSRFKDSYSGEDNKSYHLGDSWYWINNIAVIAMDDLNEKKYRSDISKILRASTNDILKMGTLGFGSEISSFKEQRAEGCLAQFWSSSTYIEMVDKLFERK